MSSCYYLAYGSNLHPLRLLERIPSCEFIETKALEGYQLHFHKHSTTDGSGKCNMVLTQNPNDLTQVAIYRMDTQHKSLLDEFEGEGYEVTSAPLSVLGVEQEVFWYQATQNYINDDLAPYSWYKQIVLLGATHHQFPSAYLTAIEQVTAIPDPDPGRLSTHEDLILRIQNYRAGLKPTNGL